MKKMNRRQFVSSAAVAGAGMMMKDRAFAQAAATGGSADDITVGLLGAGTQGQVLMKDCLKIDGVRFKAVCDIWASFSRRRASRLLSAYKQPVNEYEDYREMLEKEQDLDAVIVATPDFMHAEHAIACLEAGKHVYCEKEMSNTLENAAKMVDAAEKSGKLMQVGHQRRSNPVYQYGLRLIREDKMCGRLTHCYGQWNRGVQPLREWSDRYVIDQALLTKYGYKDMQQFRNWRWFREYSAGPIADLGSHQIDIFSWFLESDPEQVVAMGGSDYFKDREWYEDVLATYRYPYKYEGKTGSARAFYQVLNTNSYGHYFERFSGDGGAMTTSESTKNCFWVPEPGHRVPDWMADVETVDHGGHPVYPLVPTIAKKSPEAAQAMEEIQTKNVHQLHLENFFNAVRAGDKSMLTCPPEDAYRTAVAVLQVIPAVKAGGGYEFNSAEFKA